jgi:predicted ATPase
MKIAKRMYALAQERNDSALLIKAHLALAGTLYWSGDFGAARQNALRSVQICRSRDVQSSVEEVDAPAIPCLCYAALCEWHSGAVDSCHATMEEAISLAKDLNDVHGLAVAKWHAGILACLEHNPAEVERLASELIELSTRQNFALWLAGGAVLRGWARSVSGSSAKGLSWIADGLADLRAIGATLFVPFYLGLKAEALHLADRTSEALEAIREADSLVERFEGRCCSAELRRLRGVFLATIAGDEIQIEAAFREAVRLAKEQESISLQKRAEATYAEYCRQKPRALGGRGLRLPLC